MAETECSRQLLRAAGVGDAAEVKRALANGAHVDATDDDGVTALVIAAKASHLNVVEELLAQGADVSKTGRWKYTALGYAITYGHTLIAKKLIAAGTDVEDINHDTDGYDSDSDDDTTTFYRESALIRAICSDKEITDVLLARNVNVNVVDKNGHSALMLASGGKIPAIVEKLLRAGADPNYEEQLGRQNGSSLLAAINSGCERTVELLLAAGARVNSVDLTLTTAVRKKTRGDPQASVGEAPRLGRSEL